MIALRPLPFTPVSAMGAKMSQLFFANSWKASPTVPPPCGEGTVPAVGDCAVGSFADGPLFSPLATVPFARLLTARSVQPVRDGAVGPFANGAPFSPLARVPFAGLLTGRTVQSVGDGTVRPFAD